ncbi:LysM peptidoglycan-binding domain-containing protein [Roseibacillus ishigakijimensis]|uniref:LysM peptidoglycan-binding domain-containing protein n=1 Tax=Roseibacillus ishigakijimensis TaxID=454146 RepID=A0A934RUL6_9BACT|nr:LysM peptidoglycan-binding domain-containing protein [Roseibacillus ishigakijimensis]
MAAAASGGDFSVEEPNLGVARALIVILILHVAAIIAIVIHSSTNKDEVVQSSPVARSEEKSKQTQRTEQLSKPKIAKEDRWVWVEAGDTYERIARRNNVDVAELRRLNENTALSLGHALILPPPLPPVPQPEPAPQQESLPARAELVENTPSPAIQREQLPPIEEVPARHSLPPEFEVVEGEQPVEVFPTEQRVPVEQEVTVNRPEAPVLPAATVEAPGVQEALVAPQPAPQVVEATPPAPQPAPQPATKSYTVRKGDTLWAIANRNGISVQQLVAANGHVDPKRMKIGTTLTIPAR